MFVPMDTLYDYLEHVINHDLVIYRFWPHGSKNIKDLVPVRDYTMTESITRPILICHDQEPLAFEQYQSHNIKHAVWFQDWPVEFRQFWLARNLRSACEVNLYDRALLTHSEHNSDQVSKYQAAGFEPVYVWTNALLARDWFRYAMVDPLLHASCTLEYDFNVYARAWSGTREYRLFFLAQLSDIAHHCRVSFGVKDSGHYLDHEFVNPRFNIRGMDIENLFGNTEITSDSSASYDAEHYRRCMIDIVLETVFDDQRVHLTEKTLRPIACGQPFMLAAGPMSLKYLHGYGFETFANVIDESYDQETNPVRRLQMIVQEMRRISRLSTQQKRTLKKTLHAIAQRNRQHFFSLDFFNQIINEYQINMQQAMIAVSASRQATELNQHLALYDKWPEFRSHPDAAPFLEAVSRQGYDQLWAANQALDHSALDLPNAVS